MLRRWAEERMYRRTVALAVSELRRAARTDNPLEKLQALEAAAQKLKDAAWLRPEAATDQFRAGIEEVARSRLATLREQAIPAVERLLAEAGKGASHDAAMLEAAGELLTFLHRHLADDPDVEALAARFRGLGGVQPPHRPVRPLSEMYHPAPSGAGCGALVGGIIVFVASILFAAR